MDFVIGSMEGKGVIKAKTVKICYKHYSSMTTLSLSSADLGYSNVGTGFGRKYFMYRQKGKAFLSDHWHIDCTQTEFYHGFL